MGEDVLNRICELEGIDSSKSELHMGIDDELGETEDFTAQMEGISETRLLTLLRGQCSVRIALDRFFLEPDTNGTYFTGFKLML